MLSKSIAVLKFIVLLTVLFINLSGQAFSQSKTEYFPGDVNIQPFTANFLEPRAGFVFQMNDNELRLDIGTSMDILQYTMSDGAVVSAGADLFTYTLLRGEKDFHFPVDAVDYLFGVNAGYRKVNRDDEYGIRFRLSHISAHMVDGHYDPAIKGWRNGRAPMVYSREFLEFIPYYSFDNLRLYAGYTYIYHIDPARLGKNVFQAGFDYFLKGVLGNNTTPFAAYDLRLAKIGEYRGNNSVMAGIKFGHANSRGFSLYYTYYSGKSIHGEYHDIDKSYSAVGFNLDL